MKNSPIKRHDALKPVSEEHHIGLLACRKIREGYRKNIELNRIKAFADWLWTNHLCEHFEFEEQYLFVILSPEHEYIKKALAEHRRIERLFHQQNDLFKTLSQIEEELEKHIRFEERILFNEIQAKATESELNAIQRHHKANNTANWQDEFWK